MDEIPKKSKSAALRGNRILDSIPHLEEIKPSIVQLLIENERQK